MIGQNVLSRYQPISRNCAKPNEQVDDAADSAMFFIGILYGISLSLIVWGLVIWATA